MCKTAIRNQLNKLGVVLRSHSNGQVEGKKTLRTKSIKAAPYGYCLVDGMLHKDPREQSILKLILKWSEQGQGHCSIARKLNAKISNPGMQRNGASLQWGSSLNDIMPKKTRTPPPDLDTLGATKRAL